MKLNASAGVCNRDTRTGFELISQPGRACLENIHLDATAVRGVDDINRIAVGRGIATRQDVAEVLVRAGIGGHGDFLRRVVPIDLGSRGKVAVSSQTVNAM